MVFVKVIAAEGEHKASRALRHAAEVITDSPAALQVQGISVALLHNRYRVSRTIRIARPALWKGVYTTIAKHGIVDTIPVKHMIFCRTDKQPI